MLNAKGAAKKLGCEATWLRKLVKSGKLPAYTYNNDGKLVKLDPSVSHQGKDICFLEEDLEAYQPGTRGRPAGAHDKIENNPKRHRLKKLPSQQC